MRLLSVEDEEQIANSMFYGTGKDGTIQIAVDPYTGKVEHFGFWDRLPGS